MANRPHYAAWPVQPPAPGAPLYEETPGGEFRPGMLFGPVVRASGFRHFPPAVAYRSVYPMSGAASPGINFQGWSPYPGNSVPNVASSHGSGFAIQAPGQHVVQAHVVNEAPWLNDPRPGSAVGPLFLSWIEESVKGSAVAGDLGSRLRAADDEPVTSSELYRLVDRVEDVIGKVSALTDVQSLDSGTECAVCPFNPCHVVPAEALLRHTLQCCSSLGDAVETSSLLKCLQYPHTVGLDTRYVDRMTDSRSSAASSSNNATLSFEDAALLSVGRALSARRDLEVTKQEPGSVDSGDLLEIPRAKAKAAMNDLLECRTLTLHTARQQFDPKGSLFFYGDAPGVVLTSLPHRSSTSHGDAMSSMPHFLRVELENCSSVTVHSISNRVAEDRLLANAGVEEDEKSHGVVEGSISMTGVQHVDRTAMLPSMLWDLGKELEAWKVMPSRCSRTVIQAATCLGRLRRVSISEWLLAHSPAYGVVLDVAMAAYVSCLVQLYLKALTTYSLSLFDQISVDAMILECPVYAEAGTWLASWLSNLYGPVNGKSVVIDMLKHCLNLCGRFLSAVPLDLHSQQVGFKNGGKIEGAADEESGISMELSKTRPKLAGDASEEILEVKQVGAAMDAIYERANLERYITSLMSVNNATQPQRIASYDMAVISANNERAKRRNYHAVCEHDGLTWQRSQQEEKRNKTKAELLAEERDYKRRRMSYRGKKLKRTPLQVLHDIIENHMSEITEAGGIGCFSKQPARTDLESHQQVQVGTLSQPNFQHHSGRDHDSKMSSTEMAGDVPRRFNGHGETSRSVRNESRHSNDRRYDEERHHSYRR